MEMVKKDTVQKVVIYARAGNGTALERQVQMLKAHAKEQRWTVSAVYTDIGKGSVRNRKGLSMMVADALCGKFDVILTADLSRLFKGRDFLPEIFDDLMTGEIGLATLSGFLNSEVNPHLLPLMIYLYQMEKDHHARRIAFAKAHKKMKGL